MPNLKFMEYTFVTDTPSLGELVQVDSECESSVAESELRALFSQTKCLLKGHFELLSGLHSEYFLRYTEVRARPRSHEWVVSNLFDEISRKFSKIDAILCPETAGFSIASDLANQLDLDLVVSKVDEDRSPTNKLSSTRLGRRPRILLVNDVVTTGDGLSQMADVARSVLGASIVGAAVFSRRPGDYGPSLDELATKLGLSREAICSLSKLLVETWDKPCYMCTTDDSALVHASKLN